MFVIPKGQQPSPVTSEPGKQPDPDLKVIPGQQPTTGETPEPSTEQGEKFDLERAMNTIRAQREEAKKLKAEIASIKTQAEREKMSESERLKAELADVQAKLATVEKQSAERTLKSNVVLAAAKMGFNDPDDAWTMIRDGELKSDEEIATALKDLASRKAYLLKAEQVSAPQTTQPKPKTGNPARPGALSLDAVKEMTPEQIIANYDAVMAAMAGSK